MKKQVKHIARVKEKCLRKLILLFFLICNILVFSQSEQRSIADSLLIKSDIYVKKGEFKIARDSIERSLSIYEELEDDKYIGNCYSKIATTYYYQGEFSDALIYYSKSIVYFQKSKFLQGVASSLNNTGAIYYYLGNYPKALDLYKKAMNIHQQLNNEVQVAIATQNIGGIYLELNDFKNAKNNFFYAKKVYENKNVTKSLSQVLNSIGDVLMNEENYNEALNYFKTSLKLARDNKEKQIELEVLFNIGKLYELKKDFQKSLINYNKSLSLSKKVNSSLYESSNLIALGTIDQNLGNNVDVIKKCEKGFEIAKRINSISIQEEACKCLYEAYKSINNLSKALQYNEQMHLLKDSLSLKKTSDKILNMKFEKEMLLDSIAHVEKERKAALVHQKVVQKKEKQRNIFIISSCFAILLAVGIFSRLNFVKKSKATLQIEKNRSEHLLHNILPEEVAEELKEKGYVDAQDFETTSILFTDFKSFTETASQLTPQELVEEINVCFRAFDNIIEQYQIEKIKTIGDAYMAAGGLPQPDASAVKNTILAALDMQTFVSKRKRENDLRNKPAFEMRVGIHVGPVVAGIVGIKKFQYDIWGDTVNTASRMESNSKVGKVNISKDTYLLVKEEKDLAFEFRGKVIAKGKGELEMYYVNKALL